MIRTERCLLHALRVNEQRPRSDAARSSRRLTETEQEIGITGLEMIHLRRWRLRWEGWVRVGGGEGWREGGRREEEVMPVGAIHHAPLYSYTRLESWHAAFQHDLRIWANCFLALPLPLPIPLSLSFPSSPRQPLSACLSLSP